MHAPPAGAHEAGPVFIRCPPRVDEQFAAKPLKNFRQQRVQRVPRQAERGHRQLPDRRRVGAADKHHRAGGHGPGEFQTGAQAESFEHGLAVTTDEFAANPVPRIVAASQIVTGTPRCRRPMPRVRPASPPPTIVMGLAGDIFNPSTAR